MAKSKNKNKNKNNKVDSLDESKTTEKSSASTTLSETNGINSSNTLVKNVIESEHISSKPQPDPESEGVSTPTEPLTQIEVVGDGAHDALTPKSQIITDITNVEPTTNQVNESTTQSKYESDPLPISKQELTDQIDADSSDCIIESKHFQINQPESNSKLSLPIEVQTNDQTSSNSSISQSSMNVLNDDDNAEDIIKQLVAAAQRGNLDILKFYLEESNENTHPISPNVTDSDGVTLVHWAALNNRLTTIKYLVSRGADPDIPAGDMLATPLLWAARSGLVYIVDYLVREAGADYTVVDKDGIGILLASVFSSNVMMVVYSLWMLKDDKSEKLENYNVGLNGVNVSDPTGRTSLHWAAYQGDMLTVDVLLNAGARVDMLDSDGFIPLHWALVNGSKAVVTSLIKAKSDIKLKTSNGRSTWDIADDMKCSSMWTSVLNERNYDTKTGERIKRFLSAESANFCAFVLPFITVPLFIHLLTLNIHWILRILAFLIAVVCQQLTLKHVIIPSINRGKINMLKTPFLAGVFSSTAYWSIVTWLFKMLKATIQAKPIANFLCLIGSVITISLYVKAMNMDPGYVPAQTDPEAVRETISKLIKSREFDSNHYCLYSNIQKPLRSKFIEDKKLNIARFDHHCPWTNNNIGVRNHKVFFGFTIGLEITILSWLSITLNYFDKHLPPSNNAQTCYYYPHDLCAASNESSFLFGLFWWVILQTLWLSILLLVQGFQISRGVTTYEFSHSHKIDSKQNIFSSIPMDDTLDGYDSNKEDEIAATNAEDNNSVDDSSHLLKDSLSPDAKTLVYSAGILPTILNTKMCRMIGLDQMLFITTEIIHRRDNTNRDSLFNYGFKQNWLDFLFLIRIGDHYCLRTLLSTPVRGEGNINSDLIDYYTLYNVPKTV